MSNTGSFALITGGSSGIGFQLARCFAKDKHPIILAARGEDRLKQASEALRTEGAPRVETISVDLSKSDGPAKLFQAVHQLGVQVEYLVNDAGVGVFGDFVRMTDLSDELSMIQLNVVATVQLTKLFAPAMVERRSGRILNLSSITSKAPSPNLAIYSATKAFNQVFSEAIANELKDTGVTVTALMPDLVGTNFFQQAGMADTAVGKSEKADPAQVAEIGYRAMMKGEDHVIAPPKSRLTAALASVLPESFITEKAKAK